MTAQVHGFLRQHRDRIVRAWEARVLGEARDVPLTGLALRDDVPDLLDALATWLEGDAPAGEAVLASRALCHVLDRLDGGLGVAQVLHEYRLLRETILEIVLAEEDAHERRALSAEEGNRARRVKELARLHAGLDVALSDSIVAFVQERDRRMNEAQRAELALLAESEARARAVQDNIRDQLIVVTPIRHDDGTVVDWRYVDANSAALELVGVSLVGRTMREVLGPAREEELRPRLLEVLGSGEAWRYEASFAGRRLLVTVFRIDAHHLASASLDITERVRAEEALRTSEELARARAAELETVLDTVPAAVWIARDPRGDRIDANRYGAELLRRPPRANVSVTAPGDDRASNFTVRRGGRVLAPDELAIQRAARLGVEVRDAEVDIVFSDGEVRHLLGNATPLRDALGRVKGSVGAFIDVTARREAEERLRRTTALVGALADAVPDPLFAKDAEGRLTFANPATLRAIGKPPGEVLGRAEAEWLDDAAQAAAIRANDLEVMASGEVRLVEEEMRTPDGPRVFLGSKAPLRDGDGRVVGIVGLSRDITDRKALERRLRESDRRKSEFLAQLSHELRNPLAPIRNAIALLEKAPPASLAAQRAREVLRRQAEQLTRLVDDLLDISRITFGKIDVQLARLDAREVARTAYADARALFDERGVALALAEDPEPLWVDVDAARLAQMLGNLLHNALKFTPQGGSVRLSVARRGGACELAVRDDGAGLDPSELGRIFDPFVQADRARQGGHGGLGLGLALVRELAVAHGGEARAESGGIGHGAEFFVTLPLAQAPPHAAGPAEPGAGAAGLRVLVVDDNEDAAITLADLLALDGNAVTTAATGAEGIRACLLDPPDVLLCDVGLPDQSGHDVMRAIRAAENGRRTFAIALTGYAQPEDRQAALAAGFDAHLSKPAPRDELQALLAEAAARRAGSAPAPSPASWGAAASAS